MGASQEKKKPNDNSITMKTFVDNDKTPKITYLGNTMKSIKATYLIMANPTQPIQEEEKKKELTETTSIDSENNNKTTVNTSLRPTRQSARFDQIATVIAEIEPNVNEEDTDTEREEMDIVNDLPNNTTAVIPNIVLRNTNGCRKEENCQPERGDYSEEKTQINVESNKKVNKLRRELMSAINTAYSQQIDKMYGNNSNF
jgi:hypothetical protein